MITGTTTIGGTAPADASVVAGDLLCINCRYDLRALPRDGRCPECGASVAESVLHHEAGRSPIGVPLRLADRAWLRTLRRATALLLGAAAWQALVYVIILPGWRGALSPQVARLITMILFVTPELLAYWAVWRLAAAEPTAGIAAALGRRFGLGIRLAVGGSLLTYAYTTFVMFTEGASIISWVLPMLARCSFDAAATSFALVHLSRLGRRGDSPRLARAARVSAAFAPLMLLPVIKPVRYLYLMGVYYGMSSAPIIGYVEAVVPVAMRVHEGGPGIDLYVWSVLAAYGVWNTVLVACFCRLFGAAAGSGADRAARSASN
jgi:hypothetical protein